MATPEARLVDVETWINNNKDTVSMFNGLISFVNGRLGTIAQRVATNEMQSKPPQQQQQQLTQ